MRVGLVCAAALIASVRLSAQPSTPSGQIDTAAVAAFTEGFFPVEMTRRHIPGLVFVFVSGGEIAIARGFGAAGLEPRRAVDPEWTTFGLASVSKTITATAALQLVERRKLDLHTDVNTYLKSFKLPARHGRITLHHLLTHTAGFDERLTGVAARSRRELLPSLLYLARAMPPTFVEPGRVVSYSNHGYALIGHLVEEVSGRSFADYVRAEIFEPLGMSRSGSLNESIPEAHAVAYEVDNGRHRPLAPDYLQISSAGSFYTTGTDMGRFLIAHLRGGAYRVRRVLQPETAALMHAQQFAQIPGTTGWAYGLWEDARQGQRALLHNGGGKGYRALIYLLPQYEAGFFVAYNLADRHDEGELQEVLITQFRHRFVPESANGGTPRSKPASAAAFAGDYLYVRRARATAEKVIAIVNSLRVTGDDEGNLTIAPPLDGDQVPLIPIGARLFRRGDGRGIVGFDADVISVVGAAGQRCERAEPGVLGRLSAGLSWPNRRRRPRVCLRSTGRRIGPAFNPTSDDGPDSRCLNQSGQYVARPLVVDSHANGVLVCRDCAARVCRAGVVLAAPGGRDLRKVGQVGR